MFDQEHVETHEQWAFDYTLRGTALLDALPLQFSFDALLEAADRLEIGSPEAVEHLRIMQRERLVLFDSGTFYKSAGGKRP